jgi:hypothetical protein
MNQEVWDSLNSKLAEREQVLGQVQALEELRARGEQLRVEIDQLAATLQDELVQVRNMPQA